MQQNDRQRQYSLGYADAHGQGNSHPPNGGDASAQYDAQQQQPTDALQYPQETYEQHPNSYGNYSSDHAQATFQGQQQQQNLEGEYDYTMYSDTPVYASGGIIYGSMCIPSPFVEEAGINTGNYSSPYS